VPVELDVGVHRQWGESAEVAAYYIVAEPLTNAAKHAQASQVNVRVEGVGSNLRLSIRDDGIGGADPTKGSGAHRTQRPRRGARGQDGDLESRRKRNIPIGQLAVRRPMITTVEQVDLFWSVRG
jgi:signal transduction histidine kinase